MMSKNSGETLSEETVHDLLSTEDRLQVVRALAEDPREWGVEKVQQRLFDTSDSSADEHRRVKIRLIHKTLPRLDDANVVRYDREEAIVAPGPNFDCVATKL
jgi:hypothetical protein